MQGTFPLWQFTPQAWLPLAGFVLILALGIFVWSRNWKSLLHRIFAALNVAAALWNLDVFLLFTLRDRDLAGLVDRFFQIPMVVMPFLGLLFIFVFLGKKPSHPLVLAFGGWTAVLCLLTFSPEFIAGWEEHWFGFYGRAGKIYFLFPATHLAHLGICCRYLWKEHQSSRDHMRRNQVAYLLIAHLVFGLLCLDNFGPLYGGGRLPLGNVATLLYFLIIAVTIIRFRLLDVQVLFRYGLLYSSLTFVLSVLYFALILGLQGWFRLEVFTGSAFLPMLPALALAFAFGPIKNGLQERLDRRFFRCRTLMRDRLAGFSDSVKGLEQEKRVWDTAWSEGWSLLNPVRALVLVKEGEHLETVVAAGDFPAGTPEMSLRSEETAALRSDRLIPPGLAGGAAAVEFRVPVVGKEGFLGVCLLGPKKGGGLYTAEDVNFLDGIAGQCAMAVEKVRLLEQSRKKEWLAALGKAAAVVSHELRTPLNVMRGATALLRSRLAEKECLSLLGVVEDEIGRGDLFIKDFLSACREPGSRLHRLNLAHLMEDFVARWPGERYPGVDVRLELPDVELPVMGDAFQLSRLFQNLARNAAEAAGGDCRLDIGCRPERGGVSLRFSDDGPGIDMGRRARLFEPFFTTRKNGTGLGLSIVKGIIEAHRGRIEAANRPGGGAVFHVWFPPIDAERTVGAG